MRQVRRYDLIGPNVERAAEAGARRPKPVGLTVERGTGRRQDAREPVLVSEWVTHRVVYDDVQLIDAEAIAWTEGAVLVRWTPANTSIP